MAADTSGSGGAPAAAPALRERFAAARAEDRSAPSWSFDALSSQTSSVVAEAAPDAELLGLLEQECDGFSTPDEALLVELIAAGDRLVNHVASLQGQFVVELMERRRGSIGTTRTVDELAARLATTSYGAETLVGRAEALVEAPDVREALHRGVLTPRKAEQITDATRDLKLQQARAIQQHGVAFGEQHTAPQLRRELDAAVIAVDPEGAERAREKAMSRRRVVREPAPHQMEWFSALVSAETAAMAYTVVDGLAADCAADDTRTLDQRRADAFADLFREVLTSGYTPGGGRIPSRHGRAPAIRITATEAVLAGDDESPAVLHGYGPISAATARRLAVDATLEWRFASGPALRASDSPGVLSASVPSDSGGARVPGMSGPRANPPGTSSPVAGVPGVSAPGAGAQESQSRDSPGWGPTAGGEEAGRYVADGPIDRRVQARGGLGPPHRPSEPAGPCDDRSWRYDPMDSVLPQGRPPGLPDGTDARLLIGWVHQRGRGGHDPCSLLASGLGLLASDSYLPAQHVRDAILERDQTCRFPGCLVPAWRCQIDHIVPFDPALAAWAQWTPTCTCCAVGITRPRPNASSRWSGMPAPGSPRGALALVMCTCDCRSTLT
ncbi:HNH endonuclease [Ruania rhizosphaerae]|uniref:HNH endonuclease n=1 Tax=Ruania rhizosphaerae TaxID=1840413 RepID=UPI00135B385D|nr:HNH endonuclease [Ruania rhizosphaerae]